MESVTYRAAFGTIVPWWSFGAWWASCPRGTRFALLPSLAFRTLEEENWRSHEHILKVVSFYYRRCKELPRKHCIHIQSTDPRTDVHTMKSLCQTHGQSADKLLRTSCSRRSKSSPTMGRGDKSIPPTHTMLFSTSEMTPGSCYSLCVISPNWTEKQDLSMAVSCWKNSMRACMWGPLYSYEPSSHCRAPGRGLTQQPCSSDVSAVLQTGQDVQTLLPKCTRWALDAKGQWDTWVQHPRPPKR